MEPLGANSTAIKKWLNVDGKGVEIGAFKTPLPHISPYYVDCFDEYAGAACLLDFKSDACHLPFKSYTLDYVASSHVIEHIANPLQALGEWSRVLLPEGRIYMVIPDKTKTWDRPRVTTTAAHLIEDFGGRVDQTDGQHVADFVDGMVWSEFAPGKSGEERQQFRQALQASSEAGLEINIHFHTFEPASFPKVIEEINAARVLPRPLRILDLIENFPADNPNGFLVVLEAEPTLPQQLAATFHRTMRWWSQDWPVRSGTVRLSRKI